MHTRTIYKLLVEASTAEVMRFNQIQCDFGDAIRENYDDERFHTVDAVMNALFVKLGTENPAALPTMLPFFEIVCGNRK